MRGRAGEMLAQTEKRDGGHAAKARCQGGTEQIPPTLAEMGITKKQSSHYQQFAAMPDTDF